MGAEMRSIRPHNARRSLFEYKVEMTVLLKIMTLRFNEVVDGIDDDWGDENGSEITPKNPAFFVPCLFFGFFAKQHARRLEKEHHRTVAHGIGDCGSDRHRAAVEGGATGIPKSVSGNKTRRKFQGRKLAIFITPDDDPLRKFIAGKEILFITDLGSGNA